MTAKTIAIIAGEASGDLLGAELMRALTAQADLPLTFIGVGGGLMAEQGLQSLFAMEDIAVMGFVPVIKRLPLLMRRIRETADFIIAQKPDIVVLIDSPDFTHRVAKRVRKVLPDVPILDYVSPTVWAWRQGRAKAMRGHIDAVLALFPFEPAAYEKLNGPPCVYVGHPLITKLGVYRPYGDEAAKRAQKPFEILLLPGSRRSEITRLLPVFEKVTTYFAKQYGSAVHFILPTLVYHEGFVRQRVQPWQASVSVVSGQEAKLEAFRFARAALAASGTVTLELALVQVPTVACYKVGSLEAYIARKLIRLKTVLLPNLIADNNFVPEFLQQDCKPENLITALEKVVFDEAARQSQMVGFAEVEAALMAGTDEPPNQRAARVVLAYLR